MRALGFKGFKGLGLRGLRAFDTSYGAVISRAKGSGLWGFKLSFRKKLLAIVHSLKGQVDSKGRSL